MALRIDLWGHGHYKQAYCSFVELKSTLAALQCATFVSFRILIEMDGWTCMVVIMFLHLQGSEEGNFMSVKDLLACSKLTQSGQLILTMSGGGAIIFKISVCV